jgi:hypothetical protein
MTRTLILGLLALATGCNGRNDGVGPSYDMAMPSGAHNMTSALPLVTPPVRAATPAAYQSSPHSRVQPLVLSSADIKSRFFSAGPTNIFSILGSIDDRITGINMMSQGSSAACLHQDAVPYTITPFGQSVTMYAQCYEKVGSSQPADPGFLQFGQKDGVTYLYMAIGQGAVAAIVTPAAGDAGATATGDSYRVEAWISVGTLNAATSCGGSATWDGCSYGVIHLAADPATQSLEMTVAGIGFGYCGAQLKSDGASIYAIGSTDMGSTCNVADTLCVAASDGTSPGSCDTLNSFALAGLGRAAVAGTHQSFAASAYPAAVAGTGNTLLDGTATDALHFGPTTPTTGSGDIHN